MKFKLLVFTLLLTLPLVAFAVSSPVSNYKMVHTVNTPKITTPTTVRVEIPPVYALNRFGGDSAKVVEVSTGKVVKILHGTNQGPMFNGWDQSGIDLGYLFDNQFDSTFRLEGPVTEIIIESNGKTNISNISLVSGNAYFPTGLTLEAELTAGYDILLDRTQIKDFNNIRVSGVPSQSYRLRLYHNQPFELSEIVISNDRQYEQQYISWTAKPGVDYMVYVDLAGETQSSYSMNYDSISSKEELTLTLNAAKPNPNFVDPDDDKDGISNSKDNCLFGKNPTQVDANKNEIGDACEDFDEDGILGYKDNCPADNNVDQLDTDEDSIGNACDDYENRITERLPFLPWLAIIGAALVMGYIIFNNIKKVKPLK